MPDMTLCTNETCPYCGCCRRHQSHYEPIRSGACQTYGRWEPQIPATGTQSCDGYLPKVWTSNGTGDNDDR